jgi:NAD(P)-dependent dehydrogenase (short-subunit alcohol dehydrogenase family)
MCDLTDFEAVNDALGEACRTLNGLTGVVNCAGSISLKPAHQCTREDFNTAIEANLATAFATVRASAKHLAQSGGSVVLLSSAAATLGMPNHELIGAAKAAVEGLVRSAASTYASRGLRFNAVAPGLVSTKLSEHLRANSVSLKLSESLHPLGRIGNPSEVASAICWLLDPEQSWVTGQVLGVDGGLSQVQPRPKIAGNRS